LIWGDRSLTLAPFFPGWIAFQNFSLVGLELGEKKVGGEKKVWKQVAQKGVPTSEPWPSDSSL
jgi:hypothetical protein